MPDWGSWTRPGDRRRAPAYRPPLKSPDQWQSAAQGTEVADIPAERCSLQLKRKVPRLLTRSSLLPIQRVSEIL
jgi:hypothetical protein